MTQFNLLGKILFEGVDNFFLKENHDTKLTCNSLKDGTTQIQHLRLALSIQTNHMPKH